MTDIPTGPATAAARPGAGKRERLTTAARRAVYERGVEATSIADIARAADVPIGNVYYYFKTKNELVAEVVAHYRGVSREMTASLERRRSPKARLRGLVDAWIAQRDELAAHGCPIGTLCTELDKGASANTVDAADVLGSWLGWMERQFRDMGRPEARGLAVALLSAYQGVSVLANALDDPSLIAAEGRRLKHWIDSLASDHQPPRRRGRPQPAAGSARAPDG
jgi:TetR/AcrR family transcriptional regulator, transcriptional repressor for nem operon